MGLRDFFSNVHDQIMLIDRLPPVNKVFSYNQQQDCCHCLFTFSAPPTDSIALVGQKIFSTPFPNPSKRDKLYCTHCKIRGHTFTNFFKSSNAAAQLCTHCEMTGDTIEWCYKFYVYPPSHKLHKSRADATSLGSSAELNSKPSMTLTKEQYQDLITLLHRKDSSPSAIQIQTVIPSYPHSSSTIGIFLNFSSSSLLSTPWIIDTGAIDHMIYNTFLFTTIAATILQNFKLSNGEMVTITHVGIVQVTTNILFHKVLCEPSFSFNFFSTRKLAHELNCCLIFLFILCFIHDLSP